MPPNALLLGLLRHAARRPPPRPFSLPLPPRSFSFIPPPSPFLRPPTIQRCPRRALSLSSMFSSKKPPATPSPSTVALIARIEADANQHPHDVSKQLLLFHALAETKVNAAHELIMARWDRACELHPTSPLIQSDEAFELYLVSLLQTHSEVAVMGAVSKRESLLAAHTSPASSATSEPTSTQSDSVLSSESQLLESSTTSEHAPPPPAPKDFSSTSQSIAQAVLAGRATTSPTVPPQGTVHPTNLDVARLTTALAGGTGNSANPIHVLISEPKHAWILKLVRFVVVAVVLGFVLLSVLAVVIENSGISKSTPTANEFEHQDSRTTVKFSDVHGVDEAKEELKDVVAFLKDPSRFATLGGKLPKGVLLTGPPGTGKTMLARAVAGEAGVPFLFASGSEFDEMFVGVGARRVRDLFALARKRQPAIIFIDELDAIGGKRNARDQQYMKQTLNQLLVEMDGFRQDEGVIVISATNFPESLDQALVRPGRFDRHIAVPLPDIKGRLQILKHHMKGVIVSNDVDTTIVARGTSGFSGADLQNMVNQAAIQASKELCKEIKLDHLEWARDRIVMGAERKSAFIDEKVKRLTAYHEGGHALAAIYTDGAMPLHKVTCVPRGHALGVTSQLPQNDRMMISLKEFLADIDVSLGGRVAEELIFGSENVTSGASSDLKHATGLATQMVKNWGFSDKIGPVYLNDREENISSKKREEIEDEVRRLLEAGQTRVGELLKAKQHELHLLAEALIEHETLNLEEVKKVIRGEPIRSLKETISEDVSLMTPPAAVPSPTPASSPTPARATSSPSAPAS